MLKSITRRISPETYLKNFIDKGSEIYDLDYTNLEDIKNKHKQIRTKNDIKDFINKYQSQTTNLFLIRGGEYEHMATN